MAALVDCVLDDGSVPFSFQSRSVVVDRLIEDQFEHLSGGRPDPRVTVLVESYQRLTLEKSAFTMLRAAGYRGGFRLRWPVEAR